MIQYVELERNKIVTDNYKELNIPVKYKNAISIILNILLNCNLNDNINEILLFGSCVKQTTQGGSDVDILVITNNPLALKDIGAIRLEVDLKVIEVNVDLVFYTLQEYENGSMPLTKSIKSEHLTLYKGGKLTSEK